MADLQITASSLPHLASKTAVVTGGAHGIGLATVQLLHSLGVARTYVLSRSPPPLPSTLPPSAAFVEADISSWESLTSAFSRIEEPIDFLFANAGILAEEELLADIFEDEGGDEKGRLAEPRYPVLDVNVRGTMNTIKLGVRNMRTKGKGRGGSVVLTTSSTGFAPEAGLPVFSASKAMLHGLVRSLRMTLIKENITINAVCPAATETKLLPSNYAALIKQAGLPVSSPEHVALALVHSATAAQPRAVEAYGADPDPDPHGDRDRGGRWNGRIILTIADRFTEVEGPLAELRPRWFGAANWEATRAQQALTQKLQLEGQR